MRIAWLFDIDGTLLQTDGAAVESFSCAAREVLGIQDDLREIAFAGRTETLIVGDILRKHGVGFADGAESRFWEAVYAHMQRILAPNRGRVLPGVLDLLDALAGEPEWLIGLLTGNRTEMAEIKLAHFGLGGRFSFGGFGEQAADRDQLARQVIRRIEERHGIPPERCVVVGDTEHDIACARAAGARVVAVATGSRSRDQLAAHGPDLLLDDLSGHEALIAWARGLME
jgi:phosphoglycolate phosphatase-like HAD superfamily hydrolase